MALSLLLFLFLISYGVLVRFLIVGWLKASEQDAVSKNGTINTISIIVPVRNEASGIRILIEDLVTQLYSQEKFEIVIVDDHSEDDTRRAVEEKINTHKIRCRIVSNDGSGKKSAITTGIEAAQGDIIVTTDGDCRVLSGWLQSINDAFVSEKVKMVFGPVRINADGTFFSSIQAIEFSSLTGTGAATMARGIPTMCSGANLAFRKNTFQEVKGYKGNDHISSGDDEFLMRKVSQNFPDAIRFNNSSNGLVTTMSQHSLLNFFRQRVRWAGKWRFHSDVKSKVLAVYIFILHAMFMASPFLVFIDLRLGYVVVIFLTAKFILEYKFIRSISEWLGVKWNWLAFIVLQFTYSFYAVMVGVSSFFVKPEWKGRK